MAEVSSLAAQVSMVATMATWNAAEALEGNLSDLRTELHKHNREGTTPKDSQEYRDSYSAALRNLPLQQVRNLV